MREDNVTYEYLSLNIKDDLEPMYIDFYESLGWLSINTGKRDYYINSDPKKNLVNVKFKRNRRIQNKEELNKLQKQMEEIFEYIEKLEKKPNTKATVCAMIVGIIGIVFMAFALGTSTGETLLIVPTVIFSILTILCWSIPCFLYKKILEKEEYSLSEQIRNCIIMLEPSWSAKNLDLEVDLDEINYNGNKEVIGHLWSNLINNSIKYNKENGKLKISLKQDENNIIAKIGDTGIGMTEEQITHIFEKYYQAEKSKTMHGLGLGLTIASKILSMVNGDIEVESKLGKD